MESIHNHFPLIILGLLILWSLYERYRFTRPVGKVKRGLATWSEPLPAETRRFLETLPPLSWYEEHAFIYIQGREILIGQDIAWWRRIFLKQSWWDYVGYINLSEPENRLELRGPLSCLLAIIYGMALLVYFLTDSLSMFRGEGYGSMPVTPFYSLVIIAILAGSMVYEHFSDRKQILSILRQAMQAAKWSEFS